LIQRGLKFRIVSAVEVGDECRQVKAFFDRQPCDLLSNFSQAHKSNLNRIALLGKVALANVDRTCPRTFSRRASFFPIGSVVIRCAGMLKMCLLMASALMALRVPADEISFDFAKGTPGKAPAGFLSLVTGQGKPEKWTIMEEKVPPILAPLSPNATDNVAIKPILAVQSLQASPGHFPVLLYTNELFFDFTFTTRFKITGGTVDPCAGVIFRAQDENNYYVLRASDEGNLLWYRVVGGIQYDMLGVGVKIPIPRDVWQELRVECAGSSTCCYLNGNLAIPPPKPGSPTNDLAIIDTTFSNGKVGFWTRADSKCFFVDAHVQYSPKLPFVQVVVDDIMRSFSSSLQSVKIYAAKDAALPVIIGDPNRGELGAPGTKVEADVINRGTIYFLKIPKFVEVTLPLRDRNGDIAAALKVKMKSFPGETEATAVSKATLVKQAIETRIGTLQGIGN
jgi:hypothetical protein